MQLTYLSRIIFGWESNPYMRIMILLLVVIAYIYSSINYMNSHTFAVRNIKDQHKEFRIHMQFGADYPFISSWILLYVFFYLMPSLIFIPFLIYFSIPIMLTSMNMIIGLVLYLVFVFVISLLAFRRFKNTEK